MAEEQVARYSDEEYGSAGEEVYEQDTYEEEDEVPRAGEALNAAPLVPLVDQARGNESGGLAMSSVSALIPVDAPNDRDETEDYEGEDEFEADEQRGQDPVHIQVSDAATSTSDSVEIAMPTHDEPGGADSSNPQTAVSPKREIQESDPHDTSGPGGVRKPLISSRSFSVLAVPSVPLASAVDASQRSASVPSVPAAMLGRWANGYEQVDDGEDSPRSKHTLVPLPVLEEARPASLNEEGKDAEGGSDGEDSDDSSQSGDKMQSQAMARLRSLSLQHRQQQSVVVPVRKAKSHIYLTRLPSVSEMAAEDIALLGVPTILARYDNTPACACTDAASEANAHTRPTEGLSSPEVPSAEVAFQVQGKDVAPELSSVNELPAESDALDGQIHDVTSPGSTTDAFESSSGKPPRRETEQLLWEVQTLIKAQREDQARTTEGESSAHTGETQGLLLATVGEDNARVARDRDESLEQYGDEEFSDEYEPSEEEGADQYAGDDDAFGDTSPDTNGMSEKIDEAVGSNEAAFTGGSGDSAQIFSIAELEEDNRRETGALLREAHVLILAQREDQGAEDDGAVNDTNDSNCQPPIIDLYGEEDVFDEGEASDREDGDPYLTDNSDDPVKNDTEEMRPEPDGEKNFNIENPTDAGGTTSCISRGGSTENISLTAGLPEMQSRAHDKSDEGVVDLPNTGTPRDVSSNETASTIPRHHNETGPVTIDNQEANPDGGIVQEQSTSVTGTSTVTNPPKRPRPPPVKPTMTSQPGCRVTGAAPTTSRPTPPSRTSNNKGRAVHTPRKSNSNSPSRRDTAESGDTNTKNHNGTDASTNAAMTCTGVSKETNGSESTNSPSILDAGQAASPARPIRCSPPKQSKPMPPPDEYPVLPRKDPVPKQKKTAKKPLPPELLRELKPVKSPPNLRIDAQIVDKAKREWLFLNMFRHGDDVSKYEPFIPRSVFPQPPTNDSIARPQSASSSSPGTCRVERGKTSTPYGYGGRKLLKLQDPALLEREKNWVATKPHESAIPAYDSILDKYCATVTSPMIQRHIYQTRYQDLSPQLAFVLEKRAEKHFKQAVRAAGSPASSYRAHPTD